MREGKIGRQERSGGVLQPRRNRRISSAVSAAPASNFLRLGGTIERQMLGEMERTCRGKRGGVEEVVGALGEEGEERRGRGSMQGKTVQRKGKPLTGGARL
jgi:hypothetical protein